MPRPDPALLDPARYPFASTIETRFADLDVNRHINNVAIAAFLEDSRVRFHRRCGYLQGMVGLSSMIASIAIEYLAEAQYPDPLVVHCAVDETGRSSHRLVQLVTQGARNVAFCRSTMVAVGPDGPVPLPTSFTDTADDWRLKP
jgi:acyl-CoA thioester hydrolase